MLKQPSSEYKGFRTRGIRLSEDMLPELSRLYGARTQPMQGIMHAFDKAHTVMLVEEGLIRREHGAAILAALRTMEKDGISFTPPSSPNPGLLISIEFRECGILMNIGICPWNG